MSRQALRRLQRFSGGLLAAVVVLLLADSAFLVTAEASDLVARMVQLHLVLAVALMGVLPVFVWTHVAMHQGHTNERARTVGRYVATLAGVGALAGLGLWVLGKQSALRWLTLLHEGAFVAAVGAYVMHRMRAVVTPALTGERVAAKAAGLLVAAIWAVEVLEQPEAERPEQTLAVGLSQAATIDGHVMSREDLADAAYCAQCHEAIASRWESSAHRVSSLNDPFYAATLALAQKHRSPEELGFCGGCHDPALLMTGRMTDRHPQVGDPDADTGITCLLCHDIAEEPGRLGNGSYVLRPPDHYPYYGSEDPEEQEQNRALIQSKPEKHKATFGPPHLHSSELCLSCHKAHLPPELTRHRWLRGQNDYDPWFNSGAGGNSARTFYPPKDPQLRCQDCHMPRIEAEDPAAKGGTVPDHAFPGANTALPTVLGDREWAARNGAFLKNVLTAHIGALEVDGQRRLAPEGVVPVPAGSTLRAEVVVRNIGSGHLFPGGVADLREAWLEVRLVSDDRTLAASGLLDDAGQLDPFAYRWNAVLLDRDGRHLTEHDVEDTYVVLSARRIMLGASDIVRISVPAPDVPARLEVRVMHRKFAREYVTFALGEDAARMPVHVLAEAAVDLTPGKFTTPAPSDDAGPLLRNLGIGHLLRGDTRVAMEASEAAAQRLTDDAGPRLDLARIALADGDVPAAEQHVRAADALSPGHPTAAWLLGRIRAGQGQHERAVAAYDVALASFPRDREVLTLKAESLFRLERDEEAAAGLEAVLAIDPEHLGAHALLARIRDTQGRAEDAAHHQAAWERHRPHNEDRVAIEKARQADPALDQRANAQWVIALAPPDEGAVQADTWAAAEPAR